MLYFLEYFVRTSFWTPLLGTLSRCNRKRLNARFDLFIWIKTAILHGCAHKSFFVCLFFLEHIGCIELWNKGWCQFYFCFSCSCKQPTALFSIRCREWRKWLEAPEANCTSHTSSFLNTPCLTFPKHFSGSFYLSETALLGFTFYPLLTPPCIYKKEWNKLSGYNLRNDEM